VAITSSHPFRAYVYNDIVLRFCPAQYVDPVIDPAVSLTPLTAPIPSFLLPPVPSFLVPDDHHFLLPHVPAFILPCVPFFLLLYTVLAVVDPAVSLTPLTAPVPSFLLPLIASFFRVFLPFFFFTLPQLSLILR